jgi:RTX calcium-binding nonapeptide repeat (4 copies)
MRSARIGVALVACTATCVAAASAATIVGNKESNLLVGTKGSDRLKGKAGVDLLKGLAGNDLLIGGRARDGLVGGPGADRMLGGPGRDVIKAADGRADRLVNGGRGKNACVIDIPADLPVTRNCGSLQAGQPPKGGGGGGGGGGGPSGSGLTVTSAQGLLCLPLAGCVFTITGKGADALVGTVTAGGAVTSVANVAVNGTVTGTWLATGVYNCGAGGGSGWLVVTIGTKSTPQIPVDC